MALPLALITAAAPAAVAGQARTEETVLMSPNPDGRRSQEAWGYSDAVIAGDMIYISGVVAASRPGETGLEPAYERAYQRVGRILERAGAGWGDVVDITSYVTDVTVQMEPMVAVHRRYLTAPYPAWTVIDVDRLIPDTGITEIKVVARRAAAARPN